MGRDQSNKSVSKGEVNTNVYDNGGLFYGLTCSNSYTKAKSCVNIRRICEFGVSLDESQEILNTSSLTSSTVEDNADYVDLTPDGFISYDEIYNMDYRSMFATMNINNLKSKLNIKTGLTEYNFDHLYIDNFDGLMSTLMQSYTVQGNTQESGYSEKANYSGNYNLEKSSADYLKFRYGKSIYYYDFDEKYKDINSTKDRIPRFENSFYFYFGLKEGSTAIDLFRRDYYAECTKDMKAEGGYDISFVGNSWCNENDGYISFETNMPLPIKVIFINKFNGDNKFETEYSDVSDFYVGTVQEYGVERYKHIDFINGQTYLPTGKYKVVIIDGDEHVYEDSINFESERLTADVDSIGFACRNRDLDIMFSGLDKYNIIADYRKSNVNERPIYGMIIVGNISVDNYKVEIKPISNLFGDDYTGASVTVIDGIITSSGHGYLWTENDVLYFGAPYGEQVYNVSIMQLCSDNGQDYHDSGNYVYFNIKVSESALNMYINNIDYDIIKNFKTGWNEKNGDDNIIVNDMETQSTFYVNRLIGWNDLSNIGVWEDRNGVFQPLKILEQTDRRKDVLQPVLTSLSLKSFQYMSSNDTKYNWTADYCVPLDLANEYNEILKALFPQPSQLEVIRISLNIYIAKRIEFTNKVKAAFRINNSSTELVIGYKSKNKPVKYLVSGYSERILSKFNQDFKKIIYGYIPNEYKVLDDTLEESTHQFKLPTLTFYDFIDKNGSTIELVRKYLYDTHKIEYYDGDDIAVIEDIDTHITTLSEDYSNFRKDYPTPFIPKLNYPGLYDRKEKIAYYAAIQDNVKGTLPGESIKYTDMFADLSTANPYSMFGIHFIDKAMDFIPVNGWSNIYEMPLYSRFKYIVTKSIVGPRPSSYNVEVYRNTIMAPNERIVYTLEKNVSDGEIYTIVAYYDDNNVIQYSANYSNLHTEGFRLTMDGFIKGYVLNGVVKPVLSTNRINSNNEIVDVEINTVKDLFCTGNDNERETKYNINDDISDIIIFPFEGSVKDYYNIRNENTNVLVKDGYSSDVNKPICGGKQILLNDTWFFYNIDSDIDSDKPYSLDKIKCNYNFDTNGNDVKLHLYMYQEKIKLIDYQRIKLCNYPLYNVVKIDDYNEIFGYSTLPQIYEDGIDLTQYNVFHTFDDEWIGQTTNEIGYFNINNKYNGDIKQNNTQYFIVGEYNNMKCISPVIDYSYIVVLQDGNTVYITCSRNEGTSLVYDINYAYYMLYYDFRLTSYFTYDNLNVTEDYLNENIRNEYNIIHSDDNIVNINFVAIDTNVHNATCIKWQVNDIDYFNTSWSVTDAVGITKFCGVPILITLV